MPDNRVMRTGWNAVHTPPAPAHIQKRAFIPFKTAKGIPAAHLSCQAYFTHLAKIVVHLQHVPSSAFYHKTPLMNAHHYTPMECENE